MAIFRWHALQGAWIGSRQSVCLKMAVFIGLRATFPVMLLIRPRDILNRHPDESSRREFRARGSVDESTSAQAYRGQFFLCYSLYPWFPSDRLGFLQAYRSDDNSSRGCRAKTCVDPRFFVGCNARVFFIL